MTPEKPPVEPPLEAWGPGLEGALRRAGLGAWRAVVLPETASTQDVARQLGLGPGHVVVAARQSAGRGRLGRAWHDPRGEGIAATFVIAAAPPGRLAAASAVGAAEAAEDLLGRPVAIKWPNDIVAGGGKLAGILIEQADGLARIGIGMNVAQTAWPPELAWRAVSLAGLGCRADRLAALCVLVPAVAGALGRADQDLAASWRQRDGLRGTVATFRSGGRVVSGTVLSADPSLGLAVLTAEGEVMLPASTTTRLEGPPGSRGGEPEGPGSDNQA